MPSVDDYDGLEPFTLDQLVDAANSVLRGQPGNQVQERTVRYYISEGLLPRPSGGPKFARYTMEHLRRLVAIRQWLDQGVSLAEASERLSLGLHGGSGDAYVRKSGQRVSAPSQLPMDAMAPMSERTLPMLEVVKRVRLTPEAILEVDANADLQRVLREARRAIKNLES
jgi:DNA-binding transcriptional MerR regulator